MGLSFFVGAFGAFTCFFGSFSLGRGFEADAGAAGFGESDGDGLFCIAGAGLFLTDLIHFGANEFSGLCAGGFALLFIAFCGLYCCFIWHGS